MSADSMSALQPPVPMVSNSSEFVFAFELGREREAGRQLIKNCGTRISTFFFLDLLPILAFRRALGECTDMPLTSEPSPMGTADLQTASSPREPPWPPSRSSPSRASSSPPTTDHHPINDSWPAKSKAFFCNDRHHNSGYGRLPISHSHSHEPRVPGHEESLVPGLHKQWSR